jgi:hypothetical protein
MGAPFSSTQQSSSVVHVMGSIEIEASGAMGGATDALAATGGALDAMGGVVTLGCATVLALGVGDAGMVTLDGVLHANANAMITMRSFMITRRCL